MGGMGVGASHVVRPRGHIRRHIMREGEHVKEQAIWWVLGRYKSDKGGTYLSFPDVAHPAYASFSTPEAALDHAKKRAKEYPDIKYIVVKGHYMVQQVDVPVLVQEL
jgi:hypothetical protein